MKFPDAPHAHHNLVLRIQTIMFVMYWCFTLGLVSIPLMTTEIKNMLYMISEHLDIFLCEVSIQVICPILIS